MKINTRRQTVLRKRAKSILAELVQDIADDQVQCAVTYAQDLLVCLTQWLEAAGHDELYDPKLEEALAKRFLSKPKKV